MGKRTSSNVLTCSTLRSHFNFPLENLVTASRTFPATARLDLQLALDQIFKQRYQAKLVGMHTQYGHETLTISHLIRDADHAPVIGPLQQQEVDTGETVPARCLNNGLWLSKVDDLLFAVLLTQAARFGQDEGLHLEIAVPPGETGSEFSRSFFDEVEKLAYQAGSGGDHELQPENVQSALEEMLFGGGILNVKILGGAVSQ